MVGKRLTIYRAMQYYYHGDGHACKCVTRLLLSAEVTDTGAQGSSDSGPGSDIIAVLVVCGVVAVVLLVVAVVLVVKISTRLRRHRKSYEYPHKDHRGIRTYVATSSFLW